MRKSNKTKTSQKEVNENTQVQVENSEIENQEVETTTEDPKITLLMEFKTFWEENCKGKITVKDAIGRQIWSYWQKITGRTDRYPGCSTCLINTVKRIKKIASEYDIIF